MHSLSLVGCCLFSDILSHFLVNLSVITTVYNSAIYLEDCVDRILSQLGDGMEVLLVDDGSTDGSGELCDTVAATVSRIRVLHLPHGGVARARQAGLEAARGEYILYIDADDEVAPTMIADMMHVAVKDDADMVVCDYNELTSEGKIYRKQQPSALDGKTVLDDMLTGKLYGALWNKLLRREWLVQSKARFPEQLHMREDLVFLSQCLPTAKRIAYLPKALYGYNRRNVHALTNNYLNETPGYYLQEALWIELILGSEHLRPATRQRLQAYFSELAYTTLRHGLFSRKQWDTRFAAHKEWALHGHGHKKALVRLALKGHYATASLLRTAIAKTR